MESKNEMTQRFLKCEDIIKNIRGTFITPHLAREINELQKGGYRVSETRLNDSHSIVIMERQINNEKFETPYFFIVKGELGKKLHFS
jgi:hypothetical protein